METIGIGDVLDIVGKIPLVKLVSKECTITRILATDANKEKCCKKHITKTQIH